jgi:phosphoribosylaminoimidazole-succinocarboxamide synthase
MELETIKQHIGDVVKETNLQGLGERVIGKVRDIYIGDDTITLVSTDRHSSFDRIIAHIPFKGEVLNQISVWWFEKTKDILPNHVISIPDPAVLVAKKLTPLPIEAVMRGYLTGTTNTSIWTHYNDGQRDFGNFVLPDGLKKNTKFDKPLFTPSTKSKDHDVTMSPQDMIAKGIMPQETLDKVEAYATALFIRGQEVALSKGLILVDTKYEFGTDENGEIYLIDEIHTPDSSRYWKAGTYQERIDAGLEPEYFDKEFVRIWLNQQCDPYTVEVLPEIPADMVAELSRRYIEIYEMLLGKTFEHDFSMSSVDRIEKNLHSMK